MPNEKTLQDLSAAFAAYHTGLGERIANLAPGNPLREQLGSLKQVIGESIEQLLTGAREHNQKMAKVVADAQTTVEQTRAAIAGKKQNLPKPKPKKPIKEVTFDPHLEEKLQLALRTPFGNRTAT